MTRPLRSLPDNPIELRNLAEELQHLNQKLEDEVRKQTLEIEQLKKQLAELRRAHFGQSSERIMGEIEAAEAAIDRLEEDLGRDNARCEAMQAALAAAGVKQEKKAPARKPLPEHLPEERIEYPAPCVCTACGGTRLTCIEAEERKVLEYVPASFKVVVHCRPRISCRDCETIMQAPLPSLPIERGTPGPALLAHVVTAKYCDHLPLHRQSAIYRRANVNIERSTMADWIGRMEFLLRPLAEEVGRHVRAGAAIHADDTPLPVLDPGRGSTKSGRFWVAVRDERNWGSTVPVGVYYQYAPDRTKARAATLLKGARGYLHADGYQGFQDLYEPDENEGGEPRLKEVACWAHARRYFYKEHVDRPSAVTTEIMATIGNLFAIEESIKGIHPDERKKVRQEQSAPILRALKGRFEHYRRHVSRKLDLGKALDYSLKRWNALTRYLEDGRLEMTNNAAERAIRPVAIGRRNWTFAGSDSGGTRAAVMYTLIESAKANGIDPEGFLANVIGRIADYPAKRIADLLPWNIAKA